MNLPELQKVIDGLNAIDELMKEAEAQNLVPLPGHFGAYHNARRWGHVYYFKSDEAAQIFNKIYSSKLPFTEKDILCTLIVKNFGK